MSVTYTCDGCGETSVQLRSFKPASWYEQTVYLKPGTIEAYKTAPFDEHPRDAIKREVHACSRRCIDKASAKYGSSPVVLPI